jgi:hypothetical protein
LGVGGLVLGPTPQTPNPQSPIPNSFFNKFFIFIIINFIAYKLYCLFN